MSLLCNYDELYDSLIKTKPRSAKSFAFSLTLFLILCLWLFWDYFCPSRKVVCRSQSQSQVLVCVLMQSNCRIAGQLPFWKLWLCDEVLVIGKNIAKYSIFIELKLILDYFHLTTFCLEYLFEVVPERSVSLHFYLYPETLFYPSLINSFLF